jgi:uncharacterized repeat protein (TIGR03843 family)
VTRDLPGELRRDGVPGGELTLHGRVLPASNATFVADLGGVSVVYKPVRGERPLWDFPDATLAHREVAAYLVSQALGWDVVPLTWLGEGPYGPGMLQVWKDTVVDVSPVDLVQAGRVPPGFLHVLDALDAHDRPVSLVHEDSGPLRRMALFDVVVNNADRKGGHVLPVPGGHRYGVDHGLTFHEDPKLRTVLWGWAGHPVTDDELGALERLHDALLGELADSLEDLITPAEIDVTRRRVRDLLDTRVFPGPPDTGYPLIPWPPF